MNVTHYLQSLSNLT